VAGLLKPGNATGPNMPLRSKIQVVHSPEAKIQNATSFFVMAWRARDFRRTAGVDAGLLPTWIGAKT
jgi:hypothetical protein